MTHPQKEISLSDPAYRIIDLCHAHAYKIHTQNIKTASQMY